ncbi:unnamed protein product [Rotaria sordida]|uniref:Uncharacterized protein n=1 Tax=Rotaria sordida TaxID=392033 RepID=A0A815KR42_9BILA|nr:unnamed protein product [Rotaria sordida]
MIFKSFKKLNDVAADASSPSSVNNVGKQKEKNYVKKPHPQRNRKKKENEHDDQIDKPMVLPTYCDIILQGLQSHESFPSIQKVFLDQTGTHFLQKYSNSSSKSLHYSFVLALTEKFPILNYLNKDVDGKMGRAPQSQPNIIQQSSTGATTITTSNESSISPNSSRRATISLIPPISTRLVNVSTINTTPVPNKLPLTTTSTNTFLYHDGRMLLTSAAKKMSNSIPATSKNTTSTATNQESNHTFTISNDNVDERVTLSNDESMWHFKISKSEQDAYDRDIHRLRFIVKPKGRASQNISITEINVLLRSTHKLRRQMLLEKKDAEFSLKVVQHQEIFHQEALIYEYSLIKNKLFSYEKLEHEARTLLDIHIRKYSISNEHFNGLSDFHPQIGVLMVPSAKSGVEKAFMFIKNLPYKMYIHIGITGLHKILAFLVIVYMNLNHWPTHKLLLMLIENSKGNSN